MLRRIMRSPAGMRRTPRRSSTVRRYWPGADGRMASAGARRTVAPMALSVPSRAVVPVTPAPTRISQGAMRCSNTGKKKNSAYNPVSMVPSQLPSATPSASPTTTITATSLR